MRQILSPEIWQSLQLGGTPLFMSEEDATFWLWAYPALLDWHRKFEWLFSPVVGNKNFPGDIWGIDEDGNLLLVETKKGRRSDPFQDFVEYEKEKRHQTLANPNQLFKRWEKLYISERNFWEKHQIDLYKGELGETKASGVIPYSSKRFATRQWSMLYTNVICPYLFMGSGYSENVKQFLYTSIPLEARTVFYIGLIYVEDHCEAVLSKKGSEHFFDLKALAGNERVFLKSLAAKELATAECVQLQCGGVI